MPILKRVGGGNVVRARSVRTDHVSGACGRIRRAYQTDPNRSRIAWTFERGRQVPVPTWSFRVNAAQIVLRLML